MLLLAGMAHGDKPPMINMHIVDAPNPTKQQIEAHRRILVSPTVNTPEPFEGFGGFCGWPKICKLDNGDLFVAFCAGYWHYSPPTPLDQYETAEYVEYLTDKHPWLKDWHCPTGGQMMWIRSTDQGKTWSRPEAFPIVHGATGITDVVQLSNGTMVAVALIEVFRSLRFNPPREPVAFATAAAGRLPMQQVFFTSTDNGHTWKVASIIIGPFLFMTTSHDFAEAPDGSLLMLTAAVPLPGGSNWEPFETERFVGVLMRSRDHTATWEIVSIISHEDFSVEEGAIAFMPDGSIGFASRPTSSWFQSFDNGKSWSSPKRIHEGSGKIPRFDAWKKGDFVVLPDGTAVLLTCGSPGGHGQVMYSRDSGRTWIKPGRDRGFQFDPIAYYPDACVLDDGTIFAVGDHQGFKNRFGHYGAEVTAMRFRIRSAEEGDGIELLPIGGGPPDRAGVSASEAAPRKQPNAPTETLSQVRPRARDAACCGTVPTIRTRGVPTLGHTPSDHAQPPRSDDDARGLQVWAVGLPQNLHVQPRGPGPPPASSAGRSPLSREK